MTPILRRTAVALGRGLALELLCAALVAARDPALEEPLLVRWLRVAVEHPLRTTCAFALLLAPRARPTADPGPFDRPDRRADHRTGASDRL